MKGASNIILSTAVSVCCIGYADPLNIVVAGGTGKFGRSLSSLLTDHDVTILARNAFLASSPSRVSTDFGWLGRGFLDKNPHVNIRDWDGGDLLDIVGDDFLGWQEDSLAKADVVINLVGGYTKQREMATERLVRESLRVNPNALQITVSPKEEDLPLLTPGAQTLKRARLDLCERMVKDNCPNVVCLRPAASDYERACDTIISLIDRKRQ